jgi:hypothetical protein
MVGFFSSTKLFFVNRLMCRMRYGGSAVRWCRFSVGPNSCVLLPSNLARMAESGTCGIIFFSFRSVKSGVAGRSSARNRKGDEIFCMSVRQLTIL